MTFLEYVCSRLLGPAETGSCWRCPFCDSSGASFSVRPPMGDKPIKFRCFRCGEWGDEFDLLKLLFPLANYPLRQAMVSELRDDFKTQEAANPVSSTRGKGRTERMNDRSTYDRDPREDTNSPTADAAFAELLDLLEAQGLESEEQRVETLKGISKALDICASERLHPAGFAEHIDHWLWVTESEAEHRAECEDADCDWGCCIQARGFTDKEAILAECERIDRKRELNKARARKALTKRVVNK